MDVFVGSVILDKKNRIFLIKEEDKNQISEGRWNLPGGSVDEGEGLIEAIVRESEEETGYCVKVESLLGCYLARKSKVRWLYVVFSARISGAKKKVADKNVKLGKWFSEKDFLEIDNSELVHPDMKIVYKKAVKNEALGLDTVKYIVYD